LVVAGAPLAVAGGCAGGTSAKGGGAPAASHMTAENPTGKTKQARGAMEFPKELKDQIDKANAGKKSGG
jgi:hypothetical protein